MLSDVMYWGALLFVLLCALWLAYKIGYLTGREIERADCIERLEELHARMLKQQREAEDMLSARQREIDRALDAK